MAQKISKKLSYIGENIKKIRQVKRISQADFAGLFNLARPSVGAYEEGRSEPKIDNVIQIANYFRISIDVLLTRKLTVSEIYSFDLLNEKLNKAHKLDVDENTIKRKPSNPGIGFIKVNEYLDYIVNHNSIDFIQSLSQIHLPIKPSTLHRAFEMNGSEMEYHQQGIHHGDILVGTQIPMEKLSSLEEKVVTIVHKNNVTTRRMEKTSKDKIILASDDPNYPHMEVLVSDIMEVWLIKSVYSSYLNPPTLLEERVLRLEKDLESIKKNLKSQ
ncbi:MAG: helix-turn-helix transcriptional regulator [Cyclobacteriaceae bacterium]